MVYTEPGLWDNLDDDDREKGYAAVKMVISMSRKARSEGILKLMNEVDSFPPLFKEGIELVADGTDPTLVKAFFVNFISSLPKGSLEAFIANIYAQGVLYIQLGTKPKVIECVLMGLFGGNTQDIKESIGSSDDFSIHKKTSIASSENRQIETPPDIEKDVLGFVPYIAYLMDHLVGDKELAILLMGYHKDYQRAVLQAIDKERSTRIKNIMLSMKNYKLFSNKLFEETKNAIFQSLDTFFEEDFHPTYHIAEGKKG